MERKLSERSSAARMFDLIKEMVPQRPGGGHFRYYESKNPLSKDSDIYVEYLPKDLAGENGYLKGTVIEVLAVGELGQGEYSVSKVLSIHYDKNKYFVSKRLDSEITVDDRVVEQAEGTILDEIIGYLPKKLESIEQDAEERELSDEEIEEEILKLQDIKNRMS